MNFLKQLLKNVVASPLTTALGAAQIYNSVHTMAVTPSAIGDPLTLVGALGGVALLGALDPWKALRQQTQDAQQLQAAPLQQPPTNQPK